MMNIPLLLTLLAVLDVLLLCCSVYLDREMSRFLRQEKVAIPRRIHRTDDRCDTAFSAVRLSGVERFAHSPLGTLIFSLCLMCSFVMLKKGGGKLTVTDGQAAVSEQRMRHIEMQPSFGACPDDTVFTFRTGY